MRWAEHVARMGEDTGVQRVLVVQIPPESPCIT